MKVGIVGAGIAGLACAAHLEESGITSVLFDKGKRPAGRLATLQLDGMAWDFGAQYLKPGGGGAFAAQVAAWRQAGLLAPWLNGPDDALVGMPHMGSLVEAQCAGRDVRFGAAVQRLESDGPVWYLSGPGLREGPFAALAIAVPSEQAAPLLSLHDLDMAREAAAARSCPCWTGLAAFAEPLADLPDFLREGGAIAWAARNNSKPGRGPAECWVIQAGPEWSRQNLERERNEVAADLLALFASETGQALPAATFLTAHRWRFAEPFGQPGRPLWNPRLRLGACGDWCMAPQIEGAWRSGVELARRIAADLLEGAAKARRAFPLPDKLA